MYQKAYDIVYVLTETNKLKVVDLQGGLTELYSFGDNRPYSICGMLHALKLMDIEWHYSEEKSYICVGTGDQKGDGTLFVFNVKLQQKSEFETKRVWKKIIHLTIIEFYL